MGTFNARNTVVLRKPCVEKSEVGGHEMGEAQVVFQDLVEKQFGFFQRSGF